MPVGFVSDHMEVMYDLDVEAAAAGRELGLPLARAATPGTDPRFVSMVTELVTERLDGAGRRWPWARSARAGTTPCPIAAGGPPAPRPAARSDGSSDPGPGRAS